MPNTDAVKAYISQLPNSEVFGTMSPEQQEKVIFGAKEMLQNYFLPAVNPNLSERAVALQTLYMLEGDSEEFSKLKRHGVASYAVKDVSVSFEEGSGDDIAPEVVRIIERLNLSLTRRGRVGRLI